MLKIQVLGKGLIPRGYGLAPRVNPFPADLTLIGTILNTNGLTVNYLNPETNKMCPLTKENLKKVYDKFGNKEVKTPERHLPGANAPQVKASEAVATNVAPTAPIAPTVPTAPTGTPEAAPAVEEVTTPQAPEQQKPEETKTEESVEEKVAAPESTAAEEKVETVEEKKDEQPAAEPLKPINAPENKSQNNNSQNNNHQQNKGNNNNNNNRK